MNMRLRTSVLVAIAVLAIAASMTTGCCPLLESAAPDAPLMPAEKPAVNTEPTLDEWARSDTKTGEFELSTVYPDGVSLTQTGEFWLEGDRVRYDLYEDGVLIRSIISPDGADAFFAQHAEKICEPSVADGPYYLRQFSVPSKTAIEDGVDDETGAARMKYLQQETYAIEGSANGWYSEDITYLVEDGTVVGIITRGCVPESDGTVGELQTSRRIFTSVEVGGEIPAGTFDLPYPVQNVD
ncbi:MAG: hypothetical protein Q7J82_03735 [Coriobacteriia bacterium]|nr:hypothetical protein [Coriobacteriia bacterium]